VTLNKRWLKQWLAMVDDMQKRFARTYR